VKKRQGKQGYPENQLQDLQGINPYKQGQKKPPATINNFFSGGVISPKNLLILIL
jgi:hypothetical protein